jgi:hypothetical protein
MTGGSDSVKRTQVKIDKMCEHFLYHHCLATQMASGCGLVQYCDMSAEWCKKVKP